jgi:hypothetical protein
MARAYLILAIAGFIPVRLAGQALERRLASVENGTVHLSFAARPGICGDGVNNIRNQEESEEWESDCDSQPVRVALEIRERAVVGIRTYLGGRWRTASGLDLGTVRPQEAVAYFLDLAAHPGDLTGDPVLPATLADSVTVWPALLRIARAAQVPVDRRRSAIFWLGQAAGAAATQALDSIAVDSRGNRELRKQAVFALSQRSANEGVPALIRIARTNHDPELRKTALFWLGQSEDPRALDLFEEILR